jgi:hypothetical protein
MKVTDRENGKLVSLSKALDNRAKILNLFIFIVFTGIAFRFASMTMAPGVDLNLTLGFIIILATGAYLVAGYRFINKAVQTESLNITKDEITIRRTGLFWQKSTIYKVPLISNFRHLAKPEITRHPLAGESFDYLGFQTQQAAINEMHGDNRLAFDYDAKTIQFGENIYSWEYETIEELLYEVTGTDFPRIEESAS